MKKLIIGTIACLMANWGICQIHTPLEISDASLQAQKLYSAMNTQSDVEISMNEQRVIEIAKEMIDRNYSNNKVYIKEIHKVSRELGELKCSSYEILISGENQDIGGYADSLKLQKKKQIIYGFLASSHSLGASIYKGYKCVINP
ncbi:MAG: hypothetical protein H6621_04170 [Halobacteriovoraceae bacterium]|nr:hypothetical protein [Halobacteriovoraceae bacterium]